MPVQHIHPIILLLENFLRERMSVTPDQLTDSDPSGFLKCRYIFFYDTPDEFIDWILLQISDLPLQSHMRKVEEEIVIIRCSLCYSSKINYR